MPHLMGNDDTQTHTRTHTCTHRGVTMLFPEQTAEQFEVCLLGVGVCSEEASVEDLKLSVCVLLSFYVCEDPS